MSKQPSPRADGLRAMREARAARAEAAKKAWATAEAKGKVRRKPKTAEVRAAGSGS